MRTAIAVAIAVAWVCAGLYAEDDFVTWKKCAYPDRPPITSNNRAGLVLFGPLSFMAANNGPFTCDRAGKE